MFGPDKNSKLPNPNIKEICFIKNVITRPNIIVGDYTYYDDKDGAEKFEEHVTHHYEFNGDKLIIGKFCQIASGVEFIMNGANHCMNRVTTYPFNIMGNGWEKTVPKMEDLPLKGDTIIGNDVWIGQNVTILPGVHIGDGADLIPTLMQICYAVAIGYVFVTIFYKSKSLIPCIITHSLINSLSIFNVQNTISLYIVPIFLIIVSLTDTIYINKTIKE